MQRDHAASRNVADTLYCHARRAVRASGLPVLEVTDARQRGDGFGARLANAFADAFAAGYEHVIAVGSDCPRLHEVDWSSVAARLEDGMPVLGPTPDASGAYLIGLSRTHFDPRAFEALPWQSPDLLGALARHLAGRSGQVPVRLEARADVNGPRDLWALVHAASSHLSCLIERLRAALGHTTPDARPVAPLVSAIPVRMASSRAPPRVNASVHP